MDLSIVIVGYNTKTFLKACIQSIKSSSLKNLKVEIIVVDNASSDDSMGMLKREFPAVIRIQNKTNLGFAKANNIGVRKTKGRYVLFLNPDTLLGPTVLCEAVEFMDLNSDVAVSSPRLELASGKLDEASHRGFPTPWNSFTHFSGLEKMFPKSKLFSGYTKGWLLDDYNPHEVDSVVGAFYLTRREAGQEVGWWDEDYFWYGDELDFSYRLKEKGWKIFFLPKLKVLHYKGVSSGIIGHTAKLSSASRETKLRSAKASTQAMKIFYDKHYKDKYPFVINWLVTFGISLLSIIRQIRYSL